MNIVVGNVVVGQDFFDREAILERIWETLLSDSILLASPRRVGKTSIMHRLIDHPRPGFRVIFLDAQNYALPEDLVADLLIKAGEIRGDPKWFVQKALRSVMKSMEEFEFWQLRIKLRDNLGERWREEGEGAIRQLLEKASKLVIIIDELPVFLHKMIQRDRDQGKHRAQDLLDWLRHIRQEPDINPYLRQLVGGSIGLPRIAHYVGAIHKINDLRQIEVGPLDREKARELARKLLDEKGIHLRPEIMEALLDRIGSFIPIFIQIMVSVVSTEIRERKAEATPALIQYCYEQRALGTEFRNSFEDYYQRLDRYYSPQESKAAKRLLRELALATESVSKSTLLASYQDELGPGSDSTQFDLLLAWLRDDFYVQEEEGTGKICFNVTWLRDWWRKYHGTRD